MKNKTLSGSSRDKTGPTPKQNKWKDGIYGMKRMTGKLYTDIWPELKTRRAKYK